MDPRTKKELEEEDLTENERAEYDQDFVSDYDDDDLWNEISDEDD